MICRTAVHHICKCIDEIRKLTTGVKIEILTPDFKGSKEALDIIIDAHPDVFNHNIEAVREIFKTARPQGNYDVSIGVLKYVKDNSSIITKSGLMVGLGEDFVQLENTFKDLKTAGCDILTAGQYIQPSKKHMPAAKYYSPEEFKKIEMLAEKCGIKHYQIGPLVRSSYRAAELV